MNIDNLHNMSIEMKIGQLFFIGLAGPGIDSVTSDLLNKVNPGGICLFARNIKERKQTRELLDSIREQSQVLPFLSLDQEGGLVDRLRRIMSPMPAPQRLKTSEQAFRFADIIAETLRILGFNMNFAPVVDVIDESRSKFSNGLYSRSFGTNTAEAIKLAGEFLSAMQLNGCLGCVKHFPGLGASEVDSHDELPNVKIGEKEFDNIDLAPYRELFTQNLASVVMVAHAAYPKLDLQERDQNGKLLPSSLSFNLVTNLLKRKLGFNGLTITDDLEMGAIMKNYGIGYACKLAILAGEDMLSICNGADSINEGYDALLDAVKCGEITEDRINQSLTRIAEAKLKLKDPRPFDEARLDKLSSDIAELTNDLN